MDPIASGQAAQFLFRSGIRLSHLKGDPQLRKAAALGLVGEGMKTTEAVNMVNHLATVYGED